MINLDSENDIKFSICSSAGGKVIISGEHSVVYGKPAIAFGIDKYTKMYLICYESKSINKCFCLINLLSLKINIKITKEELINELKFNHCELKNDNNDIEFKHKNHFINIIKTLFENIKNIINIERIIKFIESNYILITISSDIPVGFGLGSSAAFNVCIVNGLCLLINKLLKKEIFTLNKILHLSNNSEKIFHNGTPSGIDASCSLHSGVIIFNSIDNQKNIIIPKNNFFTQKIKFYLINTGIQRNGGEFIKNVSEFKKNNFELFNNIMNDIGNLTHNIIELITKENSDENDYMEFFNLIKKNQFFLKKICVSNSKIDEIINILEKNNIFAKISGAGGGGFIIAFILKEREKEAQKIFEENNIKYLDVNISNTPAKLVNYKLYKV